MPLPCSRPTSLVTRRRLLVDLGRVALGAVVLGTAAAACASDDGTEGGPDAGGGTAPGSGPRPGWARVDLGFVSAYVVAKAGEVAIVDTGVTGSEGEIEAVLADLGLGWHDVGHVLFTHKHADHIGSAAAVLTAAADAVGYAGAADLPAVSAPRPVTAVGDGDRVMGLEVIETPGHTPGHVSLLDPDGSVLFAGDAVNGDDGRVVGPNPQFSEDMDQAWASVRKLGERSFDTVVFGHGRPVEEDASTKVAALQR